MSGTSRKHEVYTAPSHRNQAPAPLTWSDSANGLRTCLIVGETTDGGDCLAYPARRSYSRADSPAPTSRPLKGERVRPQRDWLGGLDGAAGVQDAFDLVEGGGVAVQVAVLAGDTEGEAAA
jgi:hypothetical protein